MEYQYSQCNCESCQRERLKLTKKEENNDFKKLLKTFETAFKTLFERKGYKPEDLLKVPEFKKVVEETAQVFSSAIPHETPSEMKAYLEKDAFIFSGLKTHAQLTEARSYLKDDNGHIMPFSKFQEKVLKLNERYNQHYLEAEYQFAVHSAQSAANWANLQEDTSRYWLEYRTAGDEKVRAQHQALNGICLPKDDDFWTEYYPPNGWRCRCIAVEVLAREKNLSDSKKAQELGEKATTHIAPNGKNKLQMFRFNPGKEQKIFPPNNAYKKVVGAKQVEKTLKQQVDYKKVSIQELKTMYKNQNINTKNEEIIMNDGYVATANSFFINEKLRTDTPLSDRDKKIVDALDSLINTNKLKDNYIFYRNVRNDFIEATFGVVSSKNISETIDEIRRTNIASYSDKGFTSVSAIKTENVFKSRPIHLEIRAKKGTKAIVTSNFEESEIILGRNQKMNLIDILEENEKIKFIVETD